MENALPRGPTHGGASNVINTIWATVAAGLIVLGLGFYVRFRATSGVPSRAQLLWKRPSRPPTVRSGPRSAPRAARSCLWLSH
jgi:hypothetical protein